MEDGTRTKKTVFVGGIGDDVDEAVLLETFSAFGTRYCTFAVPLCSPGIYPLSPLPPASFLKMYYRRHY